MSDDSIFAYCTNTFMEQRVVCGIVWLHTTYQNL